MNMLLGAGLFMALLVLFEGRGVSFYKACGYAFGTSLILLGLMDITIRSLV